MRGPINKLTDTKIEGRIKQAQKAAREGTGKAILLGDGGGLTLQITKTGSASWLHRYLNGIAHWTERASDSPHEEIRGNARRFSNFLCDDLQAFRNNLKTGRRPS